jgi:hypothetical protein
VRAIGVPSKRPNDIASLLQQTLFVCQRGRSDNPSLGAEPRLRQCSGMSLDAFSGASTRLRPLRGSEA